MNTVLPRQAVLWLLALCLRDIKKRCVVLSRPLQCGGVRYGQVSSYALTEWSLAIPYLWSGLSIGSCADSIYPSISPFCLHMLEWSLAIPYLWSGLSKGSCGDCIYLYISLAHKGVTSLIFPVLALPLGTFIPLPSAYQLSPILSHSIDLCH